MSMDDLAFLRLAQLADSAVPIGSAAHSWGLETLTAEGSLNVAVLEPFLADYFQEIGLAESIFCRLGYRLAACSDLDTFVRQWLELNAQVSALKMARENRVASAMLGRRLLLLVQGLEEMPQLQQAIQASKMHKGDIHYGVAFGLVGGVLTLGETATVLAYLQQSLLGLVSACQRLLPLGQQQASSIVWRLKATLIAVAQQSEGSPLKIDDVALFTPLIEMGSMRHPALPTRLFIS
jgi:urease accessory protein